MYDAWGNLISSTGNTENSYLYCGEQLDSTTGLYYLRARYMNPTTGTFISMDTYQGSMFEAMENRINELRIEKQKKLLLIRKQSH